MRLLIEPSACARWPNCFLRSSAQAAQVLDEVGAGNAFLQYDLFHMQIMEGDLAATIERLLPRIGHMQIADVPGRHEPGTRRDQLRFPASRISTPSATPAGSAANTIRAVTRSKD